MSDTNSGAVKLLNAVSATGASASWKPHRSIRMGQIIISNTATCKWQESNDGETWADVSGSSTTSSAILTWESAAVFVRANVTAYTSGTVSAYLAD